MSMKSTDLEGPFRRVFDHWDARRGDALIPMRGNVPFDGILDLLPKMTILHRQPGGDITIRYFGAELASRAGRDLTGQSILTLFPEALRNSIEGAWQILVETPCAVCCAFDARYEDGSSAEIRSLHLPMRNRATEICHVVSYFERQQEPDPGPPTDRYLMGAQFIDFHAIDIGAGLPPEPSQL